MVASGSDVGRHGAVQGVPKAGPFAAVIAFLVMPDGAFVRQLYPRE